MNTELKAYIRIFLQSREHIRILFYEHEFSLYSFHIDVHFTFWTRCKIIKNDYKIIK